MPRTRELLTSRYLADRRTNEIDAAGCIPSLSVLRRQRRPLLEGRHLGRSCDRSASFLAGVMSNSVSCFSFLHASKLFPTVARSRPAGALSRSGELARTRGAGGRHRNDLLSFVLSISFCGCHRVRRGHAILTPKPPSDQCHGGFPNASGMLKAQRRDGRPGTSQQLIIDAFSPCRRTRNMTTVSPSSEVRRHPPPPPSQASGGAGF